MTCQRCVGLYLASVLVLAGCMASPPARSPHGVEVRVAPLSLTGIGYACYDVQVSSGAGASAEIVWQRGEPDRTRLGADQTVAAPGVPTPALADHATLCSDVYGSGSGGGVAYVGACDAQVDSDGNAANGVQNLVTVWVDGLYAADDSALGAWQDPCPSGCSVHVDCDANADSVAAFDLTIMRAATQGFFDVAVNFSDLYCSAKFDTCYNGDPTKPIELLFGDGLGDGSGRDWTGVLGFACTGGADTATADLQVTLEFSHVTVTCGNQTFDLPIAAKEAGSHTVSVDFGQGARDVEYALFYGQEQLLCGGQPCNKLYLNIGLNLEDLPPGCTLSAVASAESSDHPVFANGAIGGAGTTYPYVQFAALPLDTCTSNALDQPGSLVHTSYGTSPDMLVGDPPAALCVTYSGTLPAAINAQACLPPLQCVSENVSISSQADVDKYSGCTTVNSIYLDYAAAVTSLVFPNLEAVTGYFYFSNNANLTTVSFPQLKSVGTYVYLDGNTSLASVDLRSLQTVGEYLYVTGHPNLVTFDLTTALVSVGGYALFGGNPQMCIPNLPWAAIFGSPPSLSGTICP